MDHTARKDPLNDDTPTCIHAIVETMLALLMSMHGCARHQHATAPHPTGIYPVTLLINAETGDVIVNEPNEPVQTIPLVFVGFNEKGAPLFEHPDQLVKRSHAAQLAATSPSTLKRAEGNGPGKLRPVKVSARDVSYNLTELRAWMQRRSRAAPR